jgi:hypothetical protein
VGVDVKPYYSDNSVTIYHGDCREVLPGLVKPVGQAVVSDPPYGTGWVRGGGKVGEFNARHERPDWDVFSTDWIFRAPYVIAGAVFSPLSRAQEIMKAVREERYEPPAAGRKYASTIYWRKTNPRPNGPNRDAITVWPAYLPDGIEFKSYNGDTPLHPCQKPLDLMQWILGFIDPLLRIVDPFAGSGTTLVAAKKLGRKSVGIEQEERYCEIAAQRLSQEVLDLGGAA